jgi:phosphatidylglycerophosphate synthase
MSSNPQAPEGPHEPAQAGGAAFFRDITKIPNVLGILRVLMMLSAVILYYTGLPYLGLAIGICSGLTDIFDGYLARKLGLVTPLGELIDQVADVLAVFLALGLAVVEGLWPMYVLYLWGFRDISVLALRASAARQGFSLKTVGLGKVANNLNFYAFIPMIPALVMRKAGDFGTESTVFYVLSLAFIHAGLVLHWITAMIYARKYIRQYRG